VAGSRPKHRARRFDSARALLFGFPCSRITAQAARRDPLEERRIPSL